MKSVTTVLFFLALSATLCAQDYGILRNTQPKINYSEKEWQSFNFHIGVNYTTTEGVFKEFITTPIAINGAFEMRNRHILALNFTIRPSTLNKNFTHENNVWKADTSIGLATIQGLFGYQVWASKRTALYFVGALGAHELSAGSSSNNNDNCPEKEKQWTIKSFAPSVGAFFDVRNRTFDTHSSAYHDHYFRLKFMANPTYFKTIGNGVLYDIGVGYSF